MYTIGGKDDDGHLFYFVLSLMKGAADMSSATAGCELQICLLPLQVVSYRYVFCHCRL